MSIYVPNVGEKEMLKSVLSAQALQIGLYKNQVTPDPNTIFSTLTPIDIEAAGYSHKEMTNIVVTDSLTASKWYVSTNEDGKAEGQYDALDTPQEWTFTQDDVDNSNTVYGIYAWTLTISFTGGDAAAIKAGDTVTSVVGGETAIVTNVLLESGAWGVDAAGTLCLKTQSGVFQAGSLNVSAVGLADIVGDTDKKLAFVEALSEEVDITMLGQKIKYTPVISLATE